MSESSDGTPNLPATQQQQLLPTGQTAQTSVPTWFRLEVEFGLEHLKRIRLIGHPTTEAEMEDTIDGVCNQLLAGRKWQPSDAPAMRMVFRVIGDNAKYWPTVSEFLENYQSLAPRRPSSPPEQPQLPITDETLGEFGTLVRQAIRLAPNSAARVKVFGAIASAMFSEHYFGPRGREKLRREIRTAIEPYAETETR